MWIKLISRLKVVAHSQWYWLMSIAAGLALLIVALIYQHVFGEEPCVMCIHVRLWISLWIVVSFVGLVTLHNRVFNAVVHSSVILIAVALSERSYQLIGTERGFLFGDCGFTLGLPEWFAIEEWLPWLYRIETSCGYTPELGFGITMAEVLILFSVGLLLLSVCITWVYFLKHD